MPEVIFSLIITGALVLLVVFTLAWCDQLITGKAGILDSVWVASFPLLSLIYFFRADGFMPRKLLITVMISVWGLRLAAHLLLRTLRQPEEKKYADLRKSWGDRQYLMMLRLFYTQGILALMFSLPLVLIMVNATPVMQPVEIIAAVVWVIAITGETVAGIQLKRFKAHPSNYNRACSTGLWKYFKRPDYFFECLVWISYFLAAGGSPWGMISAIFPAALLIVLLKMKGISSYIEKTMHSFPAIGRKKKPVDII